MTGRTACLVVLFVSAGMAQTFEERFHRGVGLYREGRFLEAAAEYEQILAEGVASAEVHFNLGNAYYRAGNTGRAILAYERAARLKPGDDDIQHNRKLASLRTVDRIEPVPELFLVGWLRMVLSVVPLSSAVGLFTLSWALLFSSLVAVYAAGAPAVVRAGRAGFFGGAVFVLVFGLLLALHLFRFDQKDEGVIMARIVTAKTSPDEQSVDAFVIHEGLKVEVGDEVAGWVRISLADGKVAWVKQTDLERI